MTKSINLIIADMLFKISLLGFVLICSGCFGKGLSTTEYRAHRGTSLLVGTNVSKGDILLEEAMNLKQQGDYTRYNERMDEAVASFGDNSLKQADIYNLLGNTYLERNDYVNALSKFTKAFDIARRESYADGNISARIGLANTYKVIGDFERSLEILLAISGESAVESKNRPDLILGLADTYSLKGDYAKAITLLKTSLPSIASGKNEAAKKSLYASLGNALMKEMAYRDAVTYFSLALNLAKKTYDTSLVIDTLNNIGFCLINLGEDDAASLKLKEGLDLARVMDLYYPEKEMYANYGLGLVNEKLKRYPEALSNHFRSIYLIENMRSSLKSEETRTFFLSSRTSVYEKMINLLISIDSGTLKKSSSYEQLARYGATPAEIAYYFSESMRARTFLENMGGKNRGATRKLIPEEIARQEDALVAKLSMLQEDTTTLETGNNITHTTRTAQAELTRNDLDKLIATIKKKYPEYAAINYPEPIQISAIPLKPNEVLLQFQVNENMTYAWVIRKNSQPTVFTIPVTRSQLSSIVRQYKAPLEDFARINEYSPELGHKLYNLLLGGIIGNIGKAENLIIVPDGPLALLPFEALVTDLSGMTRFDDKSTGITFYRDVAYLNDSYKISYYPSASILSLLRSVSGTKEKPAKAFWGLGDPVFDAGDSRVASGFQPEKSALVAKADTSGTSSDLRLRSILKREGFALSRLPETREEIIAIGSLYGLNYSSPEINLGMSATKERIKAANLSQYSYIHFATHGILNGDIPYIKEPALALTQINNKTTSDGFLTMSDVLDYRLNSDMVVLSACNTGLGKEVTGEGVIGMSRAFMMAGSRSVVVSLWSVDSDSTTILMKNFYEGIKKGNSKEAALKNARTSLAGRELSINRSRGLKVTSRSKDITSNLNHPFFWAPFILVGEYD